MMLKDLDLEPVIQNALARGFTQCDFYAERSFSARAKVSEKACASELSQEGGISLRLSNKNQVLLLKSNTISAEALLRLLDPNAPPTLPDTNFTPAAYCAEGIHHFKNKTTELMQLARRLSLENEGLRSTEINYVEKILLFEVMQNEGGKPGAIQSDREERAQLEMTSHCSRKGREICLKESRSRASINEFWSHLSGIEGRIRHRLSQVTPTSWPAPSGNIPILWSSLSVAKLCLPFLRAFEGDLVLKEFSCLNELPFPLELSFGLEDRPNQSEMKWDHEGTERRPLTLFDGARPRGLATNRSVASELAVPPTGHCRRNGFQASSRIGFWHPHLIGKKTENDLLPQIKEGLWVEDLEVLPGAIHSGKLRLRLKEASLIHQHVLGEWIEEIEWEVSLADILSSFKLFSTQNDTWGFLYTKQQQELLTEFTTPMALSEGLEIPGSVPKSHYW